MDFNSFDYLILALFLCLILYLAVSNLFKKQSFDNYFRLDKNIHWIAIAFSIIAADITFNYVMSSASVGFEKGIAIGSYEWTACIAMIIMAVYILPKFMSLRIVTINHYLELRFDHRIRLIVSIIILAVHLFDGMPSLFLSATLMIQELFGLPSDYTKYLIWAVGIFTGLIVISGGMSSMVRTNLFVVSFLLVAGLLVLYFCLVNIGGFDKLLSGSDGRMESILPANDPMLPWTQVFFGGLWILHIYYWAFNQVIVQNTIAADSLSRAQKGILLAATIKIFIPFIFTIPGIIGYEIFNSEVANAEMVFPVVLKNLIPGGLKGIILIAFLGTIIGSVNSFMNACSMIFTFDIYQRFLNKNADDKKLIRVSRISIGLMIAFSCSIGLLFTRFTNIFMIGQFFDCAVAPVIASVFLFGLYSKKTSANAALAGLVLALPIYVFMVWYETGLSTLTLAGINFLVTGSVIGLVTFANPLKSDIVLKEAASVKYERNLVVSIWFVFIVTMVAAVYTIF